ncbi:MAG: ATP-binding protein, partial [Kiritimatiellia bacterium]|nr:ATP-binding protein [Kiritimatiellia bacterium]
MQYVSYWNLTEAPFQNVADTRFAYLSDQHHEGLARLMYLVSNEKLGGVLTGPYGVGKSMVLQLLAEHVQKEGRSRFVGMDYLPGPVSGLARQILSLLGYKPAAESLQDAMEAIRMLREEQASLRHTVIAIDEAQMIVEPGVYHFLHLLTNVTIPNRAGRPSSSAFTLILAGYTDL